MSKGGIKYEGDVFIMKKDVIQKVKFSDLDINDFFFKSLIDDYPGFEDWFLKKSGEEAYIFKENNRLEGFLYLKDEMEDDHEIEPYFDKKRRLKIGTLKINSHGTVLGQRFLSIILRKMIQNNHDFTYVTLFKKQLGLINLFEKFGFKLWGKKNNGELVYYKSTVISNNIYSDYPLINFKNGANKYLLAIFPEYHTKMFPDSKLNTESNHVIEDLSFTNTIEKIYISGIFDTTLMQKGDLVVIYRTAEKGKHAEYNSVATSICTVVEVKNLKSFANLNDFIDYCGKGSIFSKKELNYFWTNKKRPYIIKMLYNIALNKRIIRQKLADDIGLSRHNRWSCLKLNDH